MKSFMKFLGVLLVLMIVFIGCEVKSPVGTKLDIPLRLPLLHESYLMIDLVDNENIFADEEGNFMYFYMDGLIEGDEVLEGDFKISGNPDGSGFFPLIDVLVDSLIAIPSDNEDDVEIVSATISRGWFDFYFQDMDADVLRIEVTFDGMLDTNNQTLVVPIPRGNFNDNPFRYNLTGHQFREGDPGVEPTLDDVLKDIEFTVQVIHSGNIETLPYGWMKVCYEENLEFSELTGLLHNYLVDMDDFVTQIDVDYPINLENVIEGINGAFMDIEIWNYLGFEAFFYGTVTARNTRSNITHSFDLEDVKIKARDRSSIMPDSTHIIYRDHIEDIVIIAPDKIELTDSYFRVLNPEGKVGFAQMGTAFEGSYKTIIPFRFGFNTEEYLRPSEVSDIKISKNNRDQIEEYAKNVVLNLNVRNYFSSSAILNIYLCSSDDPEQVYVKENHSENSFDRIVFLDNEVTRGGPVEYGVTKLSLEIPESQLPLFYRYDNIYYGMEVRFLDEYAEFNPIDKIDVTINMELTVRVEVKD